MCGIFAHLGTETNLVTEAEKISYRGPDSSVYKSIGDVFFGFHRLSIMGLSDESNQPLYLGDNLSLICNGEIYNYTKLIDKYRFEMTTKSDCEVILHMYERFGIEKTLRELDGVFAFCLYDKDKNELLHARDPFGVRPSFIGFNKNKEVFISSEIKAISGLCKNIEPFPPGKWWSSKQPNTFNKFYVYGYCIYRGQTEESILSNIRILLSDAVIKRLMSEREVGCLLSGGLDSSLIAALVRRYSNQPNINTFSIGMKGSPDLEYAKIVSDHIGSKHHSVELTEQDFLNAIEEVIYKIESYDTTTVRASVGNYLVSKYIRENTDVKVVFNGDGSDEVCMGYVYNKNAPSREEFFKENIRLIKDIHLFDVLRSDRSVSSNGLEARTPFLDKVFVTYYMSIPPRLKTFNNQTPEKNLLRRAFDKNNLLPRSVLWRSKCAFSDGVSSINNSWHKVIQNFIDSKISDKEFQSESKLITHCQPLLKESYYYRKVFEGHFGGHENIIPHFWMPRWTNTLDPSARELEGYNE